MSTSYFKTEEKLNDSKFSPWRDRLALTLGENDFKEYIEIKMPEPPKNATVAAKSKYKNGEIKAKKIIIDYLRAHLIIYVYKIKKSKEMYDKMIGMYEVNNLSQILSFKNQLKDMMMNK